MKGFFGGYRTYSTVFIIRKGSQNRDGQAAMGTVETDT